MVSGKSEEGGDGGHVVSEGSEEGGDGGFVVCEGSEERGGGGGLVPLYCTVYNISLKIKVFLLTVALLLSNRNIELLKERNGRLSARR